MPYTINPQAAQDSIEEFLKTTYPHLAVIPDGLVQAEVIPDGTPEGTPLPKFKDGSVKPFIVLWFNNPKRRARGRSFADYKLDSHYATVDILVVANNPTDPRKLLNNMNDQLVGFKADGGGRLHKSSSIWGNARSVDIQNKPTRWAATDRYEFGIASRKIETP